MPWSSRKPHHPRHEGGRLHAPQRRAPGDIAASGDVTLISGLENGDKLNYDLWSLCLPDLGSLDVGAYEGQEVLLNRRPCPDNCKARLVLNLPWVCVLAENPGRLWVPHPAPEKHPRHLNPLASRSSGGEDPTSATPASRF